MDAKFEKLSDAPVTWLSAGWAAPEGLTAPALRAGAPFGETSADVTAFLKDRKSAKFMSKQDKLALIAASRAVKASGLAAGELFEKTGVYFAVGPLPFEEDQLTILHDASEKDGRFELSRFTTDAFAAMNPLLTFKCLPNMPVFHVSFNLGIHGPYFVSYPGAGQWLSVLEHAIADLHAGRASYAVVGAVVDQRNLLARHHLARTRPELLARALDCACVWVLAAPGAPVPSGCAPLARVTGLELKYAPADPFVLAPGECVPGGLAGVPLEIALQGSLGERRFSCDDGVSGWLRLEAHS